MNNGKYSFLVNCTAILYQQYRKCIIVQLRFTCETELLFGIWDSFMSETFMPAHLEYSHANMSIIGQKYWSQEFFIKLAIKHMKYSLLECLLVYI